MSGSPSPIRLTTPTSLLNSSSSPALNILSSSSDLINEHNDSNPTDSETNHKLKPQSIPKSSSMFSILNNHRFSMALNPSDFKQQQQQQYQQLQQPQQLQPEELGILDRMSRLQKTLREQNLFHQQLRTDIQNACDRINGWRMNLPLIINHTRLQFVAVDKNYSSQTMMEGPWLGSDPSFMNILLTTSAAGSHLSASTDDILTLVPTSASATSIAKATGKKLFQGFWSSNSSASVSIGNSLNSTTSNLNDNSTNSNGSYQQSSSLLKLASVTKPSRMFKYHDKDHPFSVLKRHYEEFIEFIRQQPKLFCRSIKNWISKQFINQLILQRKSMKNVKVSSPTETLSPSGSSSTTEDFESCDRLAFIMIYSLYGNAGNPLETKCILKFIKTTFDIVFESCSSENPFEVFENIFLYRLVFLYLRRKGKHFIKSIMTEPLFDLFSNDDLEVPLDISPVSSQPTSQEKSESNKPSKPPILFFQNTCSVNTNDVSPVSPDCVTSSVFNTQQQMKQQLITQSMIDANLL
ncbi:hypothetical protein C9374_002846 [Naegleria lovaniensis]|uniref:Uncharacterized protein n=1 Tax=Naegleria lovaniensis TaxID=51637 RepID=A0AA88GT49_NAELO|nr:uncharacterized protein C9374_002846 [Naegleria lovaniensis]KAG2386400.1 hypothetical protein C9374_002846 [Naegleria lovaniensis]